ncbi:MAG TPA: thiamine phosphate synthase [Acidobacteriaceae bacterium]|nr:thiamine phosphate synthase [Acidobacteriaceae bacterium]
MPFPRLYAILDADLLQARGLDLVVFASELTAAGVTLFQYRNKTGSVRAILNDCAKLQNLRAEKNLRLILNDRADLTLLAGFDGVHVGQEDLAPDDARHIVGSSRWVGVSTHSPRQVIEANKTGCDYIAYGPIFSTATKHNPDPTVGLDGLRHARTLTAKPLVAIGGITRENCGSVLEAGADSIAMISALLPMTSCPTTRQIAEELLAVLDNG